MKGPHGHEPELHTTMAVARCRRGAGASLARVAFAERAARADPPVSAPLSPDLSSQRGPRVLAPCHQRPWRRVATVFHPRTVRSRAEVEAEHRDGPGERLGILCRWRGLCRS